MQELLNRLNELKQEKSRLNAELKDINKELEEVEAKVLDSLDTMGVTQIKDSTLSVSVRETIVPTVTDWDAFYKYILDNKAMFMLDRRPAAAAFREFLELYGAPPPGVEPYTKRALSVRKA